MEQHRYEKDDDGDLITGQDEGTADTPLALTLDVEKYAYFFEGEDITPEQKRDYLEALWSIVVTFIAMGVEVLPASKNCGKTSLNGDCHAENGASVVNSEAQNLDKKFGQAADQTGDSAERRLRQ